jgi:hypothetical protein
MMNSRPGYRIIVAASLIVGPLLMSIGDAIHPEEDADAADQAALIIDHAARWYAAHLLFFGMLATIPGMLGLSSLAAERRPAVGYAARVLILIGVAAFCGVFVTEMLIGRYVSEGADAAATTALLETFQSGRVLGAVMVGGIAFFAGVGAFAIPLVKDGGSFRWPALAFIVGALLILAEIMTSEVLLSQAGNVVILAAGAVFAWMILESDRPGLQSRPTSVSAG